MTATEISATTTNNTLRTVIITVLITLFLVASVYWLFTRYLFPTHFNPVELSQKETLSLNTKLRSVNLPPISSTNHSVNSQQAQTSQRHQPAHAHSNTDDKFVDGRLISEAYSEAGSSREVRFSEREINALVAHNTQLADKLAVDLSADLISVRWLLPVDKDFPILGGKTLKLSAGVEVAYRNQQPIIALRGVSLWGVPMPDAWLGNMKNINITSQYTQHSTAGHNQNQGGFWMAFVEGIDRIEVNNNELLVTLKK